MLDRWSLLALIVASIVGMPVLVVALSVLVPDVDVWHHLATTVLGDYVSNTFALIFGVGIGVTVIGVSTAWLVAMCRFPGQRIAEWALLLPFAVPTYIMGYTYTDFFQFAGPFQTTLRDLMGWTRDDYWFPQIRTVGGAIFVMTMVLFPYVYLLARTAFLSQSRCLLDVSRTLGRTPWRHFVEIGLPMARPAIAGGVALALMETVADFGTVQYFGINTFTTGIYRTWFALGEPIAAAQLSAMLMVFVLVILWLERHHRGEARYDHTTAMRPLKCYELTGVKKYMATAVCWLPIILGFVLPVAVLVSMTIEQGDAMFLGKFWTLARNSFSLAALSALLIVGVAILLAYAVRLRDNALVKGAVRLASLGYAIPGTVIAVGTLIPFARADNAINIWAQTYLGFSTGLL
ncbi:MAG: iron ABC transporter permease, partial [Pseudomonadota bacterium]